MWRAYWDGDVYGTNYADADYQGWKGSLALPNTGGVRLASASAQGYLTTPKLLKLGSEGSTIKVTVNSAPYFEPYQSWGEDHPQFFIIVEGPGTIVDGGSTMATPLNESADCANSDKQVTVECVKNVNASNNTPLSDRLTLTEHNVTVSGATNETRITIKTHPYSGTAHYRIFVDDIKIVKQ